MTATPIPNSYWVIPGQLMAGPFPGAQEESEARHRLRWLVQQGVTACFDLTEAEDPELMSYAALWIEEAASTGMVACHLRHAIPDFSTPPREHMTDILDSLDTLLENGEVVYLHCHGGVGRTGLTVACYLVRHGLSGESALAQLTLLRKDTPHAWKRSPETDEQWQYVLDWDA